MTRISGDATTTFTYTNAPTKTGTWGTDVRQHYSKDQPWNADQSLLTLENNGSSGILLLDGSTYLPKYAPCSGYSRGDDRWHPALAHKNERINVKSGSVEWYDVVTCMQTRTWTLPDFADTAGTRHYVDGFGPSEGNPSNDGRFAAFSSTFKMNLTDTILTSKIYVVDMDPQPPFAPYSATSKRIGPVLTLTDCNSVSTNCDIDWVSVSPSGRYAVVSFMGDHPRIYDINPATLELTIHAMPAGSKECSGHDPLQGYFYDLGHADMIVDGTNEYMVGQRRSWCTVATDDDGHAIGSVVRVSLSDNHVTSLTNPDNEATVHHISTRNLDRPGWIYAGYKNNEGGAKFTDEVVAIKLDGSAATNTDGSVERLAHKHSDFANYRAESHPVPSRDGFRVIFASNWSVLCAGCTANLTDIKPYVIDTNPLRVADTAPPTNIGNASPAAGAAVSSRTPTLTAQTANDATPPISYRFELYTGAACIALPLQSRDYAVGSTSWLVPTALNTIGTYAWHYLARDSDPALGGGPRTSTSACTTFTVDTVAPTGSNNVSPANNSTGQSITPTLITATATDTTLPVSYAFDLYNGSICTGTAVQTRAFGPATTWTPTALINNTAYAWKVRAADSAVPSNVATTPCWNFTTIAATPPATSAAFSDTFEGYSVGGPATAWTPVGTGSWSVASDGTKTYRQATLTGDAWSTAGSLSLTNYSVEARVKLISASSGGFAGLYGRWSDSTHWYYVKITSSAVELKKKVGGTISGISPAGAVSYNFSTNTWHTVKMDMSGSTITVSVDGTALITATDTSLTSGNVAVGTYNATAGFDDVYARTPDSGGTSGGGSSGIPRTYETGDAN